MTETEVKTHPTQLREGDRVMLDTGERGELRHIVNSRAVIKLDSGELANVPRSLVRQEARELCHA